MSFQPRRKGRLVLADGSRYEGRMIGAAAGPLWGEVVLNTSMTGYQEILTDPSYAGQIVVMTYPEIGNYGVHDDDDESAVPAASGLVVRRLSTHFSPGPGRRSLEGFMAEKGLSGLTEVDTRSVALRIRSEGAVIGAIGSDDHSDSELLDFALSAAQKMEPLLPRRVNRIGATHSRHTAPRLAVVDLGIKSSIVSAFEKLGAEAALWAAARSRGGRFDAAGILDGGYDAVVLSNGPGDPAVLRGAVESTRKLVGRIPILGICLGHQIAALSLGGATYKLPFGHRGANQPVLNHRTGAFHVTSQNHGYAVAEGVEGADPRIRVTYTNLNDGTIEGFADEERLIECVQFHPEASPGPHDTAFIFEDFLSRVRNRLGKEAIHAA